MKYKTIKISEGLHKKLKKFCDDENLKLNKWCEVHLQSEYLYAKEYAGLRDRQRGEGETTNKIGDLQNSKQN